LRSVKINEKENSVKIETAANNFLPHNFETYEIQAKNFDDKMIYLMEKLLDMQFHFEERLTENTAPLSWAIESVKRYYKENNIDHYEDRFNQSDEERKKLYIEDYTKIFKPTLQYFIRTLKGEGIIDTNAYIFKEKINENIDEEEDER